MRRTKGDNLTWHHPHQPGTVFLGLVPQWRTFRHGEKGKQRKRPDAWHWVPSLLRFQKVVTTVFPGPTQRGRHSTITTVSGMKTNPLVYFNRQTHSNTFPRIPNAYYLLCNHDLLMMKDVLFLGLERTVFFVSPKYGLVGWLIPKPAQTPTNHPKNHLFWQINIH